MALAETKGISDNLAAKIHNWKSEINLAEEMDFADKGGAAIITLADAQYPEVLRNIYDPPLCLYVRGVLPEMDSNTIAIVGSRRISAYGRKMAKHLTESAVFAGWKVVSGLAYGVDAVAHQTTVDAGGITVAVLGGGLARIHPQDHIPLARSIIDSGGAVISEFPMKFPVSRQSFPRRNRIVSGLSNAVLVVEAGLDSGALITAEIALEQGRSVFAVPGHVDNPQAKGCHKLIKQGAKLTEDFQDIVEDLEFLPGFARNGNSAVSSEDESADIEDNDALDLRGFTEDEQKVLKLLKKEACSFDSMAVATGIPTGILLGLLMKLEMKMIISQSPGKVYSIR